MAKSEQPKIKPIVSAIVVEPIQETSYFEPLAGEYHLIQLKDGQEVPGTDFSIGENSYKRTFEKLIGTKFAVKKNPTK